MSQEKEAEVSPAGLVVIKLIGLECHRRKRPKSALRFLPHDHTRALKEKPSSSAENKEQTGTSLRSIKNMAYNREVITVEIDVASSAVCFHAHFDIGHDLAAPTGMTSP
ncbi:hypothetical protein RRG08_000352 [Elysia crispata]|uniref:Uncharacterized protein n=1 Tax=Elysia crispata TaxID=231223 RepID=A0AAE0ZVT8_9GAST|nr:hypothetical protein RRG08_000352 [Elysia crispata]